MGKIKKILEKELGSTQSVEVYPVTSIEAVYDENNERLDSIINRKNKEIQKDLEAEVTRASNAESNLRETINNITEINENATSANIVTIDTIPNTSSSNVQQALNELFKNATFAGIATPTTNPGTPDGPVFYIANGKGTYTHFSGIEVTENEAVILYYDTVWHKEATGIASNDKLTELDTQINGEEARVIDDFSHLTLTNAAIIRNWSIYEGATSWLIEVEPGTNISIDTTGATNTCFLSFLKTNDVVIGQAPNVINGFETLVTSLRTEKGVSLSYDSTRCAMGKNDVLNMVAPADMNYLYVQNLANRIPHSITIGEATSGLVDKLNEIDSRLTAVENSSDLTDEVNAIEQELNGWDVQVSTTPGGSYVSMTLDRPIISGSVISSFNGYSNRVTFQKLDGSSWVNITGCANIRESALPLIIPDDCSNIVMSVGGEMTITIKGEIRGRIEALESDNAIFADDISMFEGISKGVSSNKPSYAYIEVADLHGDWKSLDICKILRKKNTTIPIFSPGDYNLYNPKSNGVVNPQVEEYMSRAVELGIYHCVGQHECGFTNQAAGIYGSLSKSEIFTHQEVFDYYIKPMRDVWGLPSLNTIYYYKDFASQKLRLISLYAFNTPLVDDPTDNSKILYPRSNVWYGTEQLSWLIDTLKSVPTDYHVIVMTHITPDKSIYNAYNTPYYSFGANGSVDKIVNGTPLIDIINAYVNRGTINTSYVASDTSKYPTSLFTETANGDFTNAKGVFDYFLVGDGHMDAYGKLTDTDLNAIMIVSSGQPYDMVFGDYGKTKTTVTVHAGWHKSNNTTNLVIGKIGQNVSILGQERRSGNIVLTR